MTAWGESKAANEDSRKATFVVVHHSPDSCNLLQLSVLKVVIKIK